MMVDREELRFNLTMRAEKKEIVDPALELCEPLLQAIDDGFPFTHEESRETIQTAISLAANDSPVDVRSLTLTRPCVQSVVKMTMRKQRKEIFALTIARTANATGCLNKIEPCTLSDFSFLLPDIIDSVFMNGVLARLEGMYPHDPEITHEIASLGSDAVQSTLSQYFKLTTLAREKEVGMHLKSIIRLLPYAIPLARARDDDHRWVVLTP